MSDPKSINEIHSDLFTDKPDDKFEDPVAIRRKAMDYLARREYGRGELADKLARAGYQADLVDVEVERLAEEGLQSDERFAESFVQSRVNQGKGPVRIRQELKERGLRGSAIDLALDAVEADWLALARDVRERRFGSSLPAEFREKARQMRFLQYRGFESDHVTAAVSGRGAD